MIDSHLTILTCTLTDAVIKGRKNPWDDPHRSPP